MCAALFLGGRYALDAMDTGFGTEHVVGAGGVDLEDTVCEAGLAARDRVVGGVGEEIAAPGPAGAERGVHLKEGGGEEGGLRAAGAGVDLDKAWEVGEGVGRGEGAFQVRGELGEGGGCVGDVGRGERAELGVTGWVGEEGLEFGEGLR